jgi:hypothetical protein
MALIVVASYEMMIGHHELNIKLTSMSDGAISAHDALHNQRNALGESLELSL